MKILRLLAASALAALVSFAAIGQTSTTGPWASGQLPQLAYAALPAASSVPSGVRFTATDLGTNGTDVVSNGTRWRVSTGTASLVQLGATTGAITNTEAIVCQTKLPVNAWLTNDVIRVWITATKNGATDIGNLSVHVGTAGTTADTAITGLSAFAMLAASGVAGGGIFDIKLVGSTSAQKIGANVVNTHAYTASGSTAVAAATTITDASANSLWVSVGLASAGATNTLTGTSCQIQLLTP